MNITNILTLLGVLSIQKSRTETATNTKEFNHKTLQQDLTASFLKTTLREDPGEGVSPWSGNLILTAFSQTSIKKEKLRPSNLKKTPVGQTQTLNSLHNLIFHHIAGNKRLTRFGARELKGSKNGKTTAQALMNSSKLVKPKTNFVDNQVKGIGKRSRRFDGPATKHHNAFQFYFLRNAVSKGALCLDGTKAGFFFRRGATSHKWLAYLHGGYWCSTPLECYKRSASYLGSIKYVHEFTEVIPIHGLFSQDPKENPPFYDWTMIHVPYCDGGSFLGNRSDPVTVQGKPIYFRGRRILKAVLDDLFQMGLENADEIVFSGVSAGGLAIMIQADFIRSCILEHIPVSFLADSGLFLDIPSVRGGHLFRKLMKDVYELHKCASALDCDCATAVKETDKWKCLVPQYFLQYVNSPLFLVQPLYDSWQLPHYLQVECTWVPSQSSLRSTCTTKQLSTIEHYKLLTQNILKTVAGKDNVSVFASSCFQHFQTYWGWEGLWIGDTQLSRHFEAWLKSRKHCTLIDSSKLFENPTCLATEFSRHDREKSKTI